MRSLGFNLIVAILSFGVGTAAASLRIPQARGELTTAVSKIDYPPPWGCDDPEGYSVEEGTDPDTHSVKIVSGGTVLHTIKLLTDRERNGFALNWAKKTKGGFEIAVEYGSRIYYAKRFMFICRDHEFYLSKIGVESFDKQNPEKWSRKVIRVRPNVPLEKFSITDFMLEGVVQH